MLSIEEIKLLIEKLERVKKEDLQELIDSNLKILKDLELAVDANNKEVIDRMDKTPEWFIKDLEQKRKNPTVDSILARQVQTKIFQFAKTNLYNSLEIGPGDGMFSMDFRSWRLNFFLDVLSDRENVIRKKFNTRHHKYLKFYTTRNTECSNIPQGSCNLVFSWDTFVELLPGRTIRQGERDQEKVQYQAPQVPEVLHYQEYGVFKHTTGQL